MNLGLIIPPLTFVAAGQSPTDGKPFQPQGQPFSSLRRTANLNGSSSGAEISIAPQSEYVKFLPNQFSQEQWQRMMKGELAPIIDGMLDYCDEFGNYSCRWFSLFWEGPPENAFIETSEINCANLYGLPPLSNAGDFYLLPCEQPEEREQREKQELENLKAVVSKASRATPVLRTTATPATK